jgi:hypothetical protein
MKDKATPSKPEDVKPAADPRAEAAQRAELCGREVETVLAKHRCRILPFLQPLEAIGADGSKAVVSASFGIIPDPLPVA